MSKIVSPNLRITDEIITKYILVENEFYFKVFRKEKDGKHIDITKIISETEGFSRINNRKGITGLDIKTINGGLFLSCSFGQGTPDGLIQLLLEEEFYWKMPLVRVFWINVKEEEEFRKEGKNPDWSFEDGYDWNIK